MTNFQPFKDKIWEAVKAEDRNAFDEACLELMKKGVDDMWRIGWNICPKDINDVYSMLDELTKWSHESWLKAMENGDAPPEDVSPGEGFALVKMRIMEAVGNGKHARKKKKS